MTKDEFFTKLFSALKRTGVVYISTIGAHQKFHKIIQCLDEEQDRYQEIPHFAPDFTVINTKDPIYGELVPAIVSLWDSAKKETNEEDQLTVLFDHLAKLWLQPTDKNWAYVHTTPRG